MKVRTIGLILVVLPLLVASSGRKSKQKKTLSVKEDGKQALGSGLGFIPVVNAALGYHFARKKAAATATARRKEMMRRRKEMMRLLEKQKRFCVEKKLPHNFDSISKNSTDEEIASALRGLHSLTKDFRDILMYQDYIQEHEHCFKVFYSDKTFTFRLRYFSEEELAGMTVARRANDASRLSALVRAWLVAQVEMVQDALRDEGISFKQEMPDSMSNTKLNDEKCRLWDLYYTHSDAYKKWQAKKSRGERRLIGNQFTSISLCLTIAFAGALILLLVVYLSRRRKAASDNVPEQIEVVVHG